MLHMPRFCSVPALVGLTVSGPALQPKLLVTLCIDCRTRSAAGCGHTPPSSWPTLRIQATLLLRAGCRPRQSHKRALAKSGAGSDQVALCSTVNSALWKACHAKIH